MSITLRKIKPETPISEFSAPYSDLARGVRVTEKNYVQVANHFLTQVDEITEAVGQVKIDANGDESKHKIKFKIKGIGWRTAFVGDVVIRDGVKGEYGIYIRREKDFAGFIN